MLRIALLTASFLAFPLGVWAHGGETLGRVEKDGYTVLLDAIVPGFVAGESERMNLEIERLSATSTPSQAEGQAEEVVFTGIWVRITGGDDAIHFVGTIDRAPEGFVTGFSFLFPEAGNYEVTTRFMNGERQLVEVSFPVVVAASKEMRSKKYGYDASLFLLGALAGAIGMRGFRK